MISPEHLATLAASGITPEHAALRGYETIRDPRRLAELGIAKAGQRTQGLLVPQLRADVSTWGWQYRPDSPRERNGKTVKYETPFGQRNGIDVPPGVGPMLGDPAIPLWVTEGSKKADCAVLHGLCTRLVARCVVVACKNRWGGKTAVADWNDVALDDRRAILAFDSDVTTKLAVAKALCALAEYLTYRGARVEYLNLPDDGEKCGLDDYLMGHTVEDLWRLVKPVQPTPRPQGPYTPPNNSATAQPRRSTEVPKPDPAQPITLQAAHATFRKWLGKDYDTDALDLCLVTAAVEKLDGDPLWVLIVGGSGHAKTETVQPFRSVGGIVVSSISSEAALLSATQKRDRAADATGGLLRRLGDRGLLVIKDVTSILSMDHVTRGRVLSALREIYDGHWNREVGAEGGRVIPWDGRIAVIGAVTTAWDTHHAVIASMGDRFTLLRTDSREADTRGAAARRAIRNTGGETQMRTELAAAVAGVIAGMNTEPVELTDDEEDTIADAANLTTLARTGVDCDFRGDVIDAHAPEMPTRCAKQLVQIVRGGAAIGMDRADALRLAIRCARDSMPPLRLAIIDDVAHNPHSSTQEVRRRIDKPRTTVDRQLQALHMLGVLTCDEQPYSDRFGNEKSRWFYSLADDIDVDVLNLEKLPGKVKNGGEGEGKSDEQDEKQDEETDGVGGPSYFSGQLFDADDPSPNGQNPHRDTTRRPGCVCIGQPKPCQWCELAATTAGR